MKNRSAVGQRVQLALGSAILALLIVGTVSYRAVLMSVESQRWVKHTDDVLDNLNALLAGMESAEASYRGFALSGDEADFAAYLAGIDNAERAETAVRTLTSDNPTQQRRLPHLDELVSEKVRFGNAVVILRRTRGLQAAADAVQSGSGRQIMKQLYASVQEMQNEELQLMVLRNEEAERRITQTKVIVLLGTAIGILIAVIAGWSARRAHIARELAEEARREGEERFRDLANNISQLAWIADRNGSITWYNKRWFDYTGTTLKEMAGSGWKKALHPDQSERVVEKITRCMQSGEVWEDTFLLRAQDGTYHPFLSRAVPICDAEGNISRWFGTNTDISERQRIEDELFAEKERAQITLKSIGDAVICTDMESNITFLNPIAKKMTGWPGQEALGHHVTEVFQILDATSRKTIPNPLELAMVQNQVLSLPLNCVLLQRNGVEIPVEDSVAPIHDRQGNVTGAVIVFRDVSAAQAIAQQMAYLAQHDFLTGLPNRMLLNDRVNQAIALAPRHKRKVAVLFLDLDGFKHINDSLGHAVGDKLLQSVAGRLANCLRETDSISRQGGDEFVVLLSEIEAAEDAAMIAQRMLQSVGAVHSIDQYNLHVTTSIGISVHPDDGLDSETLVKNADIAMYHAKEHGRRSYQFFKQDMNLRAVERQSIEESLRNALGNHEFVVHYQPKVDLRTGDITGAEALLRWEHPVRGMVSPAEFIPIAEESGLIVPIGSWVLRESCRQACAWLDAGLPLKTIAVNISAIEFRDGHFLESVFSILDETGLDPGHLELELTESILMKSTEATSLMLKTLRAKGIQIAIDDFGTGYSSLSYLTKFPVDVIKIDQSFVRHIDAAHDNTAIVTAIIGMGRSLNLRVVAEGVESLEELEFLQAHQCDEAQGYYFSRPEVAGQFAKLLQDGITVSFPSINGHALLPRV